MSEFKSAEASTAAKVLIVEDEAGLRFLTSDFLTHDAGFTVVEARTADEAIEILKAMADIQCVFTDVRMPGRFDGVALTRHVKEHYPDLPVMMTSGNLHPGDLVTDVPFMAKPYDLQMLSVAIREMIDNLRRE